MTSSNVCITREHDQRATHHGTEGEGKKDRRSKKSGHKRAMDGAEKGTQGEDGTKAKTFLMKKLKFTRAVRDTGILREWMLSA